MQDASFDNNVTAPLPHSKVGIAAFAVSLLGGSIFCIGAAIAFLVGYNSASNNTTLDPSLPTFQLAAVAMCGSLLINMVAIGLGIGSLFQPQRNKTFGIIGLVLSTLVICIYGALAIIGFIQ